MGCNLRGDGSMGFSDSGKFSFAREKSPVRDPFLFILAPTTFASDVTIQTLVLHTCYHSKLQFINDTLKSPTKSY